MIDLTEDCVHSYVHALGHPYRCICLGCGAEVYAPGYETEPEEPEHEPTAPAEEPGENEQEAPQ